jgi:hypothetical protein
MTNMDDSAGRKDSQLPLFSSARQLLSGYSRGSIVVLVLLLACQTAIGIVFHPLVAANMWMWRDPLLWGVWIFMTALLTWDIRPRRDGMLVAAGFFGGLVIEWWGTTTTLWTYFTAERPPIWILIAWPVAAVAIDRMARVLTLARSVLVKPLPLYLALLGGFIVWMAVYMWPFIGIPSCWAIVAIMIGTLIWRPQPTKDLCIFLAGSLLGIFLEYWGTSRHCWTYYSLQTPPPVAVFAHGFASVAFNRAVQLMERIGARLRTARGA